MPSVNNPDPDCIACKYPIQSKDEKTEEDWQGDHRKIDIQGLKWTIIIDDFTLWN